MYIRDNVIIVCASTVAIVFTILAFLAQRPNDLYVNNVFVTKIGPTCVKNIDYFSKTYSIKCNRGQMNTKFTNIRNIDGNVYITK